MRTYAVGDVHGHLSRLQQVHDLIDADRAVTGDAEAPVIHLGDLTDRGPDSRGVIDFLLAGLAANRPWQVIKGNHDRIFAGFLHDATYHDPMLRRDLEWLDPRMGGAQTLASYGVKDVENRSLAEVHAEALAKVDPAHLAFLDALPLYLVRGRAIFVHAGIRPGVPMPQQIEDDLVWIRGPFHEVTAPHEALIVHGHTVVENVTHYGNRLNIDTGAGYGDELSAVVIEGEEVWQLLPEGRRRILAQAPV